MKDPDHTQAQPEMKKDIQVSAGTAKVLGLLELTIDVAPTTAYLMLGGRCAMDCAFCSQARGSQASALMLSRVSWPHFPLEEVTREVANAYRAGRLRRACLQVTVTRGAHPSALDIVSAMRAASPIPIDVSILPDTMEQVRDLIQAGVDHIGFGLDAASRRVFEKVKGGSWRKAVEMIHLTAAEFPGRAAVHLIVGLGETERELAEIVQDLRDRQVTVGLFAFTPVRGTEMEREAPPSIGQYRRSQAMRHLLSNDLIRLEDLIFTDAGRLLAIAKPGWASWLEDGRAFETSGCQDCNRPYYNERPGATMYNYPRRLTPEEVETALSDLEMDTSGEA